MSVIYVNVLKIDGTSVICGIETAVLLFIYKYLHNEYNKSMFLHFVTDFNLNEEETIVVDVTNFNFTCGSDNSKDFVLQNCNFPSYLCSKNYCVSGFCAVIREMIKGFENNQSLLGYKNSCLSACAEFSVWTKFCEVDLISSVKNILVRPSTTIPKDLIRLEYHLFQPVRTHNIGKKAFLLAKEKKKDFIDSITIEHSFVEGTDMLISDLIIFPLVQIFFIIYNIENFQSTLPLTYKWYKLMISQEKISSCASIFIIRRTFTSHPLITPVVKVESMYKCDPKRYNPVKKAFTHQNDIDRVLRIIDSIEILKKYDYHDNSVLYENFSWDNIPFHANPEGGDLPDNRLCRKKHQLENIVKSVLKVVDENDIIVDFCCGGGHVGILLAYLLPNCSIILLDNKEYSLRKAHDRMKHLNLNNIRVVQSNVDYFIGNFHVGVSLHACGVATDLVIDKCVQNRSKFVVAPCCYGKLQENHVLHYPKSELLKNSVSLQDYFVLGHTADQTHKNEYSKTEQGEKCMRIIDIDRCLHAEENKYRVYLAKMIPVTCSPKNNFIIGLPE